jgi:hypothetical protein
MVTGLPVCYPQYNPSVIRNFVAMLLVVLIAAQSPASNADRPVFSKHATYAYMGQPVHSPDGKKTVVIRALPDDNSEDHPAAVIATKGQTKFTSRINFALKLRSCGVPIPTLSPSAGASPEQVACT